MAVKKLLGFRAAQVQQFSQMAQRNFLGQIPLKEQSFQDAPWNIGLASQPFGKFVGQL
jgi:hypothetical protein